jgi:hypothetical protein
MTTYYVGPGGSDAANGTSWATRKLTLTGAEAIPVVAGDTVYVGPGTYREMLTLNVSGSSGSPITYIGDWTGANTDQVGGLVRVTGSDDDATATRTFGFDGGTTARNFRSFRGFFIDMTTSNTMRNSGGTDWVVEDCWLMSLPSNGIQMNGANLANCIIRRCVIMGKAGVSSVLFSHSVTTSNQNLLVENCIFIGCGIGVRSDRVGGITVKHCTMIGNLAGVRVGTALAAGQTITVEDCIIAFCSVGLQATATGEITEDYNVLSGNNTDRTTVTAGTHSTADIFSFDPVQFFSGLRVNKLFGQLTSWSPIAHQAGTAMSTEDIFGIARPATDSKKSWGAVQADLVERSSAQAHAGTYSILLSDASRTQFIIPVTNVSTTFTVYVYREANYAGTNPQMIVKQPGQSDTTVTDAAASGQWNALTTTLTPAAGTKWVVVELVSNNTATSGSYKVYFDDLAVS